MQLSPFVALDNPKPFFQTFANNSEKIAPCGSTREVESFNNMITSKAPKRCHFSETTNLALRVGCAVSQKNMGNTYLKEINERAGLSPGKIAHDIGLKRDKERKRQLDFTNRRDVKRRKIEIKHKSVKTIKSKEKREGATYQTGIAATHYGDISSIPPPQVQPKCKKIEDVQDKNLVFCDIETGSLQSDADILQLSACFKDKKFNRYINPSRPIDRRSTQVHGLISKGGSLFKNGSPVSAVPLHDALKDFIDFLQGEGPAILVGHNLKAFDFPRILRAFQDTDLESEFLSICVGGIDSLHVFRHLLPNESCHKQESLVQSVLQENYSAHDAMEDVLYLQKLWNSVVEDTHIVFLYSFDSRWASKSLSHQNSSKKNVVSFQPLIDNDVIKKAMATKMSKSGLCFNHLKQAFCHGGVDGLKGILTEMIPDGSGKQSPRCTKTERILDSIVQFFMKNVR